jgi:hypothetical protein
MLLLCWLCLSTLTIIPALSLSVLPFSGRVPPCSGLTFHVRHSPPQLSTVHLQPFGNSSSTAAKQSFQSNVEDAWGNVIKNRSGILIFLIPAMISQYRLLSAAFPFFIDRAFQYIHPLQFISLGALYSKAGVHAARFVLCASIASGVVCMLQDSFALGSVWSSMTPKNDSVAIVLGYVLCMCMNYLSTSSLYMCPCVVPLLHWMKL